KKKRTLPDALPNQNCSPRLPLYSSTALPQHIILFLCLSKNTTATQYHHYLPLPVMRLSDHGTWFGPCLGSSNRLSSSDVGEIVDKS
ncbi:hypothetical protein M8C21_020748, partial [Ambrosia artemisiifolia]